MDSAIVQMIVRSGGVARTLLIILAIFSIVTWAIIFARLVYFAKIKKANKRFAARFAGLASLREADALTSDPALASATLAQICSAGSTEVNRILTDSRAHTGVTDWSFFLDAQFSIAGEKIDAVLTSMAVGMDKGLMALSISSSVSPLLGLLGTVWGITNAFYEIGNQGSASLPVVAPGIAEALITTILGLAVAVPALFFYNYFVHEAENIENQTAEFKAGVIVSLKREILQLLFGSANATTSAKAR